MTYNSDFFSGTDSIKFCLIARTVEYYLSSSPSKYETRAEQQVTVYDDKPFLSLATGSVNSLSYYQYHNSNWSYKQYKINLTLNQYKTNDNITLPTITWDCFKIANTDNTQQLLDYDFSQYPGNKINLKDPSTGDDGWLRQAITISLDPILELDNYYIYWSLDGEHWQRLDYCFEVKRPVIFNPIFPASLGINLNQTEQIQQFLF